MTDRSLRLVLVSTPIGWVGSGAGGGVELTLSSLVQGLAQQGHQLTLIAPRGSSLPKGCSTLSIKLVEVAGADQPSWQHADEDAPVLIPPMGVLPAMLEEALRLSAEADAVLNFGYDWLPMWITPWVPAPMFHLISMGAVSMVMKRAIESVSRWNQGRLAFHTLRQASDFDLLQPARVVGNGFDLSQYIFREESGGPLGWAGRIAPEKGLEDAAAAAAALGDRLLVWGLREDDAYANAVEAAVPAGTIEWRGFLSTSDLQKELGDCRALLNTPKWNEAYGNVVVEAMACGVPVIAYDRGGPGELVRSGENGLLVSPDDVSELTAAVSRCETIQRRACRDWVERHASCAVFSQRVETWIREGLAADGNITAMH
ncbi:glycosyltransferase family 4 protein [Synechococcus sp. MIT S1220]|uniref:glycosyltransferase family 4 protein n=1 Tax=Synechococcus sp. MIT S1220 TaxID=3082549 RepID=UPI0039B025F4